LLRLRTIDRPQSQPSGSSNVFPAFPHRRLSHRVSCSGKRHKLDYDIYAGGLFLSAAK
jgi:hypothetical protein